MRTKLSLLAAIALAASILLSVGVGLAANKPTYTAPLKLTNTQQASPTASGFVTVWFNSDKSMMFYTISLNNAYGPFHVTLVRNNQTVATLHAGTPGTTCPTDKSQLYNGLLRNAQIQLLGASGAQSNGLPAQIASGNVYAVVKTSCGTMQSLLRLVSSNTPATTTSVSILSPTTKGTIPGSTNNTQGTLVNAKQNLVFSWKPVEGANAYRVSLVQENANGTVAGEYFIAHHSASDPNPTQFTMSMLGWTQYLCGTCRSKLVVKPELAQQTFDNATQQFVWSYELLPGGTPQNSAHFWLIGLN